MAYEVSTTAPALSSSANDKRVRLFTRNGHDRHERVPQTGGFEVRFSDNRPSKFFYSTTSLRGGCGRTFY
jgi:hypothetical protein